MLFQISGTVMDTISLLDIVTHDKFTVFLACNKIWRSQTKIRKICCDIILVLTGISQQGHGNKCIVEKMIFEVVTIIIEEIEEVTTIKEEDIKTTKNTEILSI